MIFLCTNITLLYICRKSKLAYRIRIYSGHTSKFRPIAPKIDFTLTPQDSDRISCENEERAGEVLR